METIDLRSDTVTHPTPAMREAMANAPVGDDVYGEDPLINQLEQDAADMFGMEAGLFVSSGTQGNLVSVMTHCQRGEEAIIGDQSHIFKYEQGGIAALAGVMPHTVPVQPDGTLSLDDIAHAIRADNDHFPRTRLIALENTQGTLGGLPLSPAYMHEVIKFAHNHDLKLHVDGARIFNASTHFGVSVAEMVRGADSVTFCLSKALCAPIGSIIVGSKAFIKEARRNRKILGGGMRQTGIIAAAGSIALHEMSQRLQTDHDNAHYLAESISEIPGVRVMSQATNFVFFWLEDDAKLQPTEFITEMKKHNIILSPYPGFERKFRCVMHYWITRERIDEVKAAMEAVLS